MKHNKENNNMYTILCFGDSNTYGLKSDLITRYARNIRWTGVLQEILGPDFYVIEEGLGGRTTVWDDPIEEDKNGRTYLIPCLESHKPIDLIVLMLGTNDLKSRFSVTPYDIGLSMENLVHLILHSESGINFQPPQILLVTPVPIHSVGRDDLDQMIPDMAARSRAIEPYYRLIAEKCHLYYLNPDQDIEINPTDGIHYTEKGHKRMAELVAEKILSEVINR